MCLHLELRGQLLGGATGVCSISQACRRERVVGTRDIKSYPLKMGTLIGIDLLHKIESILTRNEYQDQPIQSLSHYLDQG